MIPCPVICNELARRMHPYLFDPMRDFERKHDIGEHRGLWRQIAATMIAVVGDEQRMTDALVKMSPQTLSPQDIAAFVSEFFAQRPSRGNPQWGMPCFGSV